MSSIFDDLITQAAADDHVSPVEFKFFYTIVQVYRSTPEECDISQRAWAVRANVAYGGIGKMQRHLEELGYISITPTHFNERKEVAIAVLYQGRPITHEHMSKGKGWKWRSSYLLPKNAQQQNRWRVTVEEYTDEESERGERGTAGWNEQDEDEDDHVRNLAV